MFEENHICDGCPACIDENDTIWINKYMFNKYDPMEQKAILLHEAGHVVIGFLRTSTDTEYYAHLWAMRVAKSNGWIGLYKTLETTIISWSNFDWNEDKGMWRRYIKASKKYLKRKHEKKKIKGIIKV
jgi:hypothetical protein